MYLFVYFLWTSPARVLCVSNPTSLPCCWHVGSFAGGVGEAGELEKGVFRWMWCENFLGVSPPPPTQMNFVAVTDSLIGVDQRRIPHVPLSRVSVVLNVGERLEANTELLQGFAQSYRRPFRLEEEKEGETGLAEIITAHQTILVWWAVIISAKPKNGGAITLWLTPSELYQMQKIVWVTFPATGRGKDLEMSKDDLIVLN